VCATRECERVSARVKVKPKHVRARVRKTKHERARASKREREDLTLKFSERGSHALPHQRTYKHGF